MTSRARTAELARRLVDRGLLNERSTHYLPVARTAGDAGPVCLPVGRAGTNPFLGSVETAAGPRGDARPRRVGHPPAPCPAAIPPE